MKILLAVGSVFSSIGGGQRFFSNLIRANPEIDFYYFSESADPVPDLPGNAHPVALTDVYRRNFDTLVPGGALPGAADSLQGKHYDICHLLDMAASVASLSFDVLDIPDYLPFGALLRECMNFHHVSIGKVTLSMHGTLSNVLLDTWADDKPDLAQLMDYEQLLYRYADDRYGISEPYTQAWREQTGFAAALVSPRLAMAPAAAPATAAVHRHAGVLAQTGRGGVARPDLCFIGRQEKCKGPDLFIEICAGLPVDLYGRLRLVGPAVSINGNSSTAALEQLARNRSLSVVSETIAPAAMENWLRGERMIVILPSRKDTFNLVVLEALLAGCPVVVSSACGACQYLDAAYPGLPHVRLDPDHITASREAIVDLLVNYDARKAELQAYLARHKAPPDGAMPIRALYQRPGSADPLARERVAAVFGAYRAVIEGGVAQVRDRLALDCDERVAALARSGHRLAIAPGYASAQFLAASASEDLLRRFTPPGAVEDALDAVQARLPQLEAMAMGGDRVNLSRLMALWEMHRGNELLYAAYQIRAGRLSGRFERAEVARLADILARHQFREEALALRLLDEDNADAIEAYLRRRAAADYKLPAIEFSRRADLRGEHGAAVSVIVPVRHDAGKAELFIAHLERFTEPAKTLMEVIFVDGGACADTAAFLPQRLELARQRGVRALYVRTPAPETAEAAWNRGIDLARGAYLALLGLADHLRPDALEIMAAYLDAHREVDWVQGNAVASAVNAHGSYLRDLAFHERGSDLQDMHYLDRHRVAHVGTLYRKSVHDRFGYYDSSLRAAGATEFKNRVLPSITVASLPETLGFLLRYPDDGTAHGITHSEPDSLAAELEELRAWQLFRTVGGLRYGLDGRPAETAVALFHKSMHYKPCDAERWSTDVELAATLGRYLAQARPADYERVEQYMPGIGGLQLAYRRFDELAAPGGKQGLERLYRFAGALDRVWYWIDAAQRDHQALGWPAHYAIDRDQRRHAPLGLLPSAAVPAAAVSAPSAAGSDAEAVLARDLSAHACGDVPFSERKVLDLLRQLADEDGAAAPAHWPFLYQPVLDLPAGETLSFQRIMAMVWQVRPDLQALFPLAEPGRRLEFVLWCLLVGSREYGALRACLNAAVAAQLERPAAVPDPQSAWDAVMPRVWTLLHAMRPDLRDSFDPRQPAGRRGWLFWYLSAGRAELQLDAFPLPAQLRAMLDAPLPAAGPGTALITGLMALQYQARADLQALFDLSRDEGVAAYRQWHRLYGVHFADHDGDTALLRA